MDLQKFTELAKEHLTSLENKKGMFGRNEVEINGIKELYEALIIHFVSGSFIINGFEITQQKNLHPSMLSWQAKHLLKDITFAGKTKKECISWCENYR